MRILVVGAGSTGGYFGGRLAQAGRDVTFLVRPRRAQQLRERGLEIVSPSGHVALAPKLVTAGSIDGPFDAVLLTVKAYSLEAALADMAPAIGVDTMILPVLNGMRHLDILTERFGRRAIAGCACKVVTIVDDEGRIVQLAPLEDLAYGELDGTLSQRIRALDATMQGAGIKARLSPDIEQEMWEKWVLLAALGGITCLMRGHVGEVNAAPGGGEFTSRFIDEIDAIVSAEGHPPSPGFLSGARALLTDAASTQTSSMFRDMSRGRPIEADQIIGDLLARGRRHGVATPLLATAFANLSIYQARLNAA